MSTKYYPKNQPTQLSPNFQSKEFDCPCHNVECKYTFVDDLMVKLLQDIRDKSQKSVRINSAYRCQKHQQDLAAQGYETAKKSQHLEGKAVDISVGDMTGDEIEKLARAVGFKAVGVAGTWCHLDMRPEHRTWSYASRPKKV